LKKLAHPLTILFITSLVSFFLCIPANSYAQFLSNKALYAKGYNSYIAYDWGYASVYLYAYIQRQPEEFLDTKYRKEVIDAYNHCINQLTRQKLEYKKLLVMQENHNNDGEGIVTEGLGTRAPILRVPSRIPAGVQQKVITDNTTSIPKLIIKKFN
jgi:hypothetical protein